MDHLPSNTQATGAFQDLCDLLALGRIALVAGQLVTAALSPAQKIYLQAWLESQDEALVDTAAERLEQAFPEVVAPYCERVRDFSPRRKRPWVQWLLGRQARLLGRNALDHYQWGIALLDQRRMNVEWLRILLLNDMAGEQARRGFEPLALDLYTSALEVCEQLSEPHLAQAEICAGLCHLYSKQETTHARARLYGKQALALYPEQARDERAWIVYRLARLTPEDAATLFREAETLATQGDLRGRIALARAHHDYRAREKEQARDGALRALAETALPLPLRAEASVLLARLEMDAQRTEDALAWCLLACDVSTSPQTLQTLSTILEEILKLDTQHALSPSWRQAYQFVITWR